MNHGERVRSELETLQVCEHEPNLRYTLESVVHLTGVSRRSILVYCRSGLVRPLEDEASGGAMSFDDEAARNGWCLYRVGCKGPSTFSHCPIFH